MKKRRVSIVDLAWATLRKGRQGKADAVFVFRFYAQEDGSWHTEGEFRHWLEVDPEQANTILPGIPGAIIGAVSGFPIQKHVGKILLAGAQQLTPMIGENAAMLATDILRNFTQK